MHPPRFRVHLSRAVALGISINLFGHQLAPPAAAQPVEHSEQGAKPPPSVSDPDEFGITSLAIGLGSMRVVAGPGINGFGSALYVLLPNVGRMVTVTPSGAINLFTNLPRWASDSTSLAFDFQGNYSGSLLLNASFNRIATCAPTGRVSFLHTHGLRASSGDRCGHVALSCDPYGAFGGGLFIMESTGSVLKVAADGHTTKLAECASLGAGRDGRYGRDHVKMLFSPGGAFGDDLYIADAAGRRILRIAPHHVPSGIDKFSRPARSSRPARRPRWSCCRPSCGLPWTVAGPRRRRTR